MFTNFITRAYLLLYLYTIVKVLGLVLANVEFVVGFVCNFINSIKYANLALHKSLTFSAFYAKRVLVSAWRDSNSRYSSSQN